MIDAENSLMLAQGIHINNEEKAIKERKDAIGYYIITKLLFTETNKIEHEFFNHIKEISSVTKNLQDQYTLC